jgi:hypothetical protein
MKFGIGRLIAKQCTHLRRSKYTIATCATTGSHVDKQMGKLCNGVQIDAKDAGYDQPGFKP